MVNAYQHRSTTATTYTARSLPGFVMRLKVCLCVSLTLLSTACKSAGGNIVLTNKGQSNYHIVLPVTPTRAENKAALILREYVKEITGVTLPINAESNTDKRPAIYVGQTAHSTTNTPAKMPAEGFLVASDAQQVYVRGGSGQGVIYGVYHLLDQYFGCKKYSNVKAYTPSLPTLKINANLFDIQHPAFIYRQSYYPTATDAEYLAWHGLQQLDDLWGMWGHSFFKLVPPSEYFKAHPEYFAQVNGKRQATQLCLSNEEVYNITIARLEKAIKQNPDAEYWSIAPEDNNNYCTCDLCKKTDAAEGGPQGSLVRFVNRVAAYFPDQHFTTLAYGYTAQPPTHTKPAGNVFIFLSSIDAYRGQPLSQEPSAAAFRQHLSGWQALTHHLFIWDYTTQFTNYLAPFPDYANLQPNIQYFASQQVAGIFSQGSGESYGDLSEWNSYLQAALLWDPKVNVTALEKEFFSGYYGAAGPYLQQYTVALSTQVKSHHVALDIYGNPVNNYKDFLSPEAIAQYADPLDKAEKAVDGNAELSQRVATARLPIEYVVLQQSRFYGIEKHGFRQQQGDIYIINPAWPARVARFVAQCKVAGVKELSEGGLPPDAYAAEWDAIFKAPWLPNKLLHAPVTLANPFAPEYPARGAATLTDGAFGSTDFSYNWLYFQRKDLEATITPVQAVTFRTLQLNYLQDARHYILPPVQIKVQTAEDGIHYNTIATQNISALNTEDWNAKVQTVKLTLPAAVTTKFIRVIASCPAAFPEWSGSTRPPAICVDEIIAGDR